MTKSLYLVKEKQERYFAVIKKCSSLTEASLELGLSQNALGQQLKRWHIDSTMLQTLLKQEGQDDLA